MMGDMDFKIDLHNYSKVLGLRDDDELNRLIGEQTALANQGRIDDGEAPLESTLRLISGVVYVPVRRLYVHVERKDGYSVNIFSDARGDIEAEERIGHLLHGPSFMQRVSWSDQRRELVTARLVVGDVP